MHETVWGGSGISAPFRSPIGGPVFDRPGPDSYSTYQEQSMINQNIVPCAELTESEARNLTDQIKTAANSLWSLILGAYEGKAWKALGYVTWEAYIDVEFDMKRAHSYRLLNQGRVIREINEAAGLSPKGDNDGEASTVVDISEREARDIKPILPKVTERIREAVIDVPPERVAEIVQEVIHEERAKVQQIAEFRKENAVIAEELGLSHDAEADEAEAKREELVRPLFRALETFDSLPSPSEIDSAIKPFERYRLQNLQAIISWLRELAEVAL